MLTEHRRGESRAEEGLGPPATTVKSMDMTNQITETALTAVRTELRETLLKTYPDADAILITSGVDRDEYGPGPKLTAVRSKAGEILALGEDFDAHPDILGVPVDEISQDAEYLNDRTQPRPLLPRRSPSRGTAGERSETQPAPPGPRQRPKRAPAVPATRRTPKSPLAGLRTPPTAAPPSTPH